jgi:hypothetical protein
MQTTTVTRVSSPEQKRRGYGDWVMTIGSDLREYRDGELRSVVSCTWLRLAMGISEGKLPVTSVAEKTIGDTLVYVNSRDHAENLAPKSSRPHRMMAVCNHCQKHIPTGRFGQHLSVHTR